MTIALIVLIVIAAMCGFGWLKNRIGLQAMILYLLSKGYTPPADAELRACCEVAVKRMFGLKP